MLAFISATPSARAQAAEVVTESVKPADDGETDLVHARERFAAGAALARTAQWAEALAAFEESSRLRPHPITTYNIGACQRALGHYTLARTTLLRALAEDTSGGVRLSESLQVEANAYIQELDGLLVHVNLTLSPADAAIAVDGRPLMATVDPDGTRKLVAGLRAAGRGEALPTPSAELVVDPGTHLLTLSRKGFSEQVVSKTFAPGSRANVSLNLARLPASLRVSSNEARSVVRIDQTDVGFAPVEVERPADSYMISVEKPGFFSYETRVRVNPGEAADIRATLSAKPITQKWWFWSVVGFAVTGAVVGTYFATRSSPTPERPPPDGGALNWAVRVPSAGP